MSTLPVDLVLDVGNSSTKAGLFVNGRLLRRGVMTNGDQEALGLLLGGDRPGYVVLGSVAAADSAFLKHVGRDAHVLEVTGETATPLQMGYASPATLGADRLANAVGAHRFMPARAVLAIDLGTCITYDMVEADGTFAGGIISPGMRMRARAMHAFSARLPLVEPNETVPILGNNTRSALEAGVHHGTLAELHGIIATYQQQRPNMGVILTGGDALRFGRALKSGIFVHPFLTLEGLHAILDHHRHLSGVAFGDGAKNSNRPRTTG